MWFTDGKHSYNIFSQPAIECFRQKGWKEVPDSAQPKPKATPAEPETSEPEPIEPENEEQKQAILESATPVSATVVKKPVTAPKSNKNPLKKKR